MILDEIRALHRKRCFLIKQRIRDSNALGSYVRLQLGWSKDLDEKASKKIKDNAAAIVKSGGEGTEFADVIAATVKACAPMDDLEKDVLKTMRRVAENLPVWKSWGKDVMGFGSAGLATIVGEAGDLSDYPTKGHLWKRMGLAVIGDIRQGGLPKGSPDALWIEHGYNRERRSKMFAYVGMPFAKMKSRTDDDGKFHPASPYRDVYDERKLYEQQKALDAGLMITPAKDIPAKNKDAYIAEGVIHLRAFRYMEKQFLKHLWQAWKRAA